MPAGYDILEPEAGYEVLEPEIPPGEIPLTPEAFSEYQSRVSPQGPPLGSEIPLAEDWAFTQATHGGLPGALAGLSSTILKPVGEAMVMPIEMLSGQRVSPTELLIPELLPPDEAKGILPSIRRMAAGFTSLEAVGALAIAPLAPRAVAGTFLGQVPQGIALSLEEIAKAKTPAEYRGAVTDLALNVGMGELMRRGLVKERKPDALHRETETVLQDVRQPEVPKEGAQPVPAPEGRAPVAETLKVGDRLPQVIRDEEGFAGSEQPQIEEALDRLPVGSQVIHKFTGNVYEKDLSGDWWHNEKTQEPGNSSQDAGQASTAGLAMARVRRIGKEKPAAETLIEPPPVPTEPVPPKPVAPPPVPAESVPPKVAPEPPKPAPPEAKPSGKSESAITIKPGDKYDLRSEDHTGTVTVTKLGQKIFRGLPADTVTFKTAKGHTLTMWVSDFKRLSEPLQEDKPAGKEPWQMTQDDFSESNPTPQVRRDADFYTEAVESALKNQRSRPGKWDSFESMAKKLELPSGATYWDVIEAGKSTPSSYELHRASVEKAIKEGKPVPPEVLADYPDLAKPAAPPKVESTETKPERGLPETASESDLVSDMTQAGRMFFEIVKGKPDEFSGVDATNLSPADRRNLARLGVSFTISRQNRIIGTWPQSKRVEQLRKTVTEPTPEAEKKAETAAAVRTTPATGTPERIALEAEWKKWNDQLSEKSRLIAEVKEKKERTGRFTKAWDSLQARLDKLEEGYYALQEASKSVRERIRKAYQEDRRESVNPIEAAKAASELGDREAYKKAEAMFLEEANRQGFDEKQAAQMFMDAWSYTIREEIGLPELVKKRGEMINAEQNARAFLEKVKSLPNLTEGERRSAEYSADNNRYRPEELAKEYERLKSYSEERTKERDVQIKRKADEATQKSLALAQRILDTPSAEWNEFVRQEAKEQFTTKKLAQDTLAKRADRADAQLYRFESSGKPRWVIWYTEAAARRRAQEFIDKNAPKPIPPKPTETPGGGMDFGERLRNKQDEVIAAAERRGMPEDVPISNVQVGAPTIGDLRTKIYPEFEASLNAFLEQRRSEGGEIGQGPGAKTRRESAKPEAPESVEGTGLKHAIDELERVDHGFKARTPQERQKMAEAWDRTGRETTPQQRAQLAKDLANNPRRGLTGDESAMLLRYKVEVVNALNDAAEATHSADPAKALQGRADVTHWENELNDLLDSVAERGSEWGREGRWRQALAYEDFSFENRARILRAKKGEALTHEEIEKLRQQTKADAETLQKYEDYILKLEDKYRQTQADKTVKRIETEVQRDPILGSKLFREEYSKFIAGLKKRNAPAREKVNDWKSRLASIEAGQKQGPGARTRTGAEIPDEAVREMVEDMKGLGAEKIAEGIEDPAAWDKAMLREFGPEFEPFLKDIYEASVKQHYDDIARHFGARAPKVIKAKKPMADLETQQPELIATIKEKLEGDKPEDISPFAQKLAKIAVAKGARGWRAVADAVHKQLRAVIPDLDFHTTLDMISGYGKFRPLDADALKAAYRQAKQEMQSVRKIQDVVARKPIKKTGFQFQLFSDVKRRLIAVLNEAKKKFGVVVTDPARQLQSALDARKRFYDNRIKDLEHEIKTRQRIVRERNAPPTSPELEAKIAEYRRLKAERDEIFKAQATPEQQMKAAIKALERSETEYRRRREAGEFTRPKKAEAAFKESPEYQAAEARRDAEKSAFEELRDLDEAFQRERELTGLERREAALQKTLQEKERRLAEGPPTKQPSPANRPETPRIESLLQQIEKLNAQIRAAEARPQAQRLADNLRKALVKVQATLTEERAKLVAGDLTKRQAGLAQKRPYAHKATELLAQELDRTREELRAVRKQAEELRNPKKTAAERALAAYQTRLTNRAAEQAGRLEYLKARLESGEITQADLTRPKREPLDISKTPELVALKAKSDALRNDILRAEREAAYRVKPWLAKAWYRFKQARGAVVNIASSFDFSAPRQALGAILSNLTRLVTNPTTAPGMLARPVWNMFKSWWSEANAAKIETARKIRSERNGGLDKIAGIEYTDLATEKFTRYEENAHSILDQWAGEPLRVNLAAPIIAGSKLVRMSNRAFIAFLNSTRSELFEHLLRINFKDRPPTELELKAIGNLVNLVTGRGALSPKAAQITSEILWAPKLLASRVQLLAGQPFYQGNLKTRGIVAREYARMLTSAAVLAMVSQLFDDDNEGEPSMISSNFGKVRLGDTTVDLWGGFQQPLVLTARFVTGQRETRKGDIVEIGAEAKYGEGLWLVGTQFVRSKLRPDIGAAVDFLTRKNFVGEPWTPGMAAESLLVPLPMRDVAAVMREHGLPEALILEILNQFGASVHQHEERTSR